MSRTISWRRSGALPGFGLSLGLASAYLGLLVLLPLAALLAKLLNVSAADVWRVAGDARVGAAFRLSLGASLAAATFNLVFGFLVAWVLTRYEFPGRRLLDALVDLPFALPTAVSGIALTTLYAPTGWLGRGFDAAGLQVAFRPAGVLIALIFIGLPFVVRALQPALADLDPEVEEAAASLGAGPGRTFWRVILPAVLPAALTGFALAFARALGEYGSVIFIAGNLPLKTEIVPLLIVMKLEQFDYAGAVVLGSAMLAVSFALLLAINLLQAWSQRRLSGELL